MRKDSYFMAVGCGACIGIGIVSIAFIGLFLISPLFLLLLPFTVGYPLLWFGAFLGTVIMLQKSGASNRELAITIVGNIGLSLIAFAMIKQVTPYWQALLFEYWFYFLCMLILINLFAYTLGFCSLWLRKE